MTTVDEQRASVRIVADRDICFGAGMCVMTAPDLFDQDDELGQVLVLKERPGPSRREAAQRAAFLCPSGALSLEEDPRTLESADG
jgi:ferredoxin